MCPQRSQLRSGITLIEMLVVMVIILGAFGATMSITSVLGQGTLRSAATRMATAIEYVYGRAAINGIRYQLVFDLDADEYWIECSEENIELPTRMLEEDEPDEGDEPSIEEGARRFARYDADDEEADPFSLNQTALWDDCTEPLVPRVSISERFEGIEIHSVMTTHQEEPFEVGQATIGFFPNGFVEPSMIWLREAENEGEAFDEDNPAMTLVIEPMTGSVRVLSGLAEVPDDFLDVEEDR